MWSQNGESGESGEVAEQLAWERARRAKLGVPAVAGGFLYLLGAVIIGSALSKAPTVGLLQAISPALKGEGTPRESPRVAEVRYISHHAFALIAGSALSTLALLALTAVLVLLVRATRFRRPQSWQATGPLVLIGGVGFAAVAIGHQVVAAILTHDFATGHDFSNHAVDRALSTGPVNVVVSYISLLAGLSLTVGMISASLGAMRAGLLTRWMSVLGIFAALLIFLPIGGETLTVVPAFWLAAMGLLYMGRWPGEEPPAWAAGEARPWPSQAELRARQRAVAADGASAASGGGAGEGEQKQLASVEEGQPTATPENGAVTAPAESVVPASSRSRRRRKRGSRR
jgi:hypothetical protein